MPKPQGKSTRLKRPSQPLWDGRSYAHAIIETVREPLLVLDSDLRVKSVNRSFYQTFRVSPEQTEDRLIYELGDRQWNIPKLRELLEEILPQDGQVENFEVDHDFSEIGRKTMLLNARRLRQEGTGAELVLLAIEDISERKGGTDNE
jgi:PAS domain S-box-containing protein